MAQISIAALEAAALLPLGLGLLPAQVLKCSDITIDGVFNKLL
jgi:hypothetical protein